MLVGDIVLAVREAITDNPQFLPPPDTPTTITPAAALTPVFAAGTYFFVVTLTTPWGETLPCAEGQVTLAGINNTFSLGLIAIDGFTASNPQITGVNVYVGNAAGVEVQQYQFPGAGLGSTVLLLSTTPVNYQTPPSRNTAYLPDSDGDAVSAGSMFRWINDALKLASQICGGLMDYSGLGSTSGKAQYIAPGQWKKISSCWYDGYPLAMDDAGNYFRRNSITASVLASVATSLFTDRMMLEVWPQPSRSGTVTTLAAPFNIGDTQAVLTSTAGFLLSDGFAKIGNEIVSYSGIVGNTLTGLIRALSGTVAASVAAGQPALELNLFWQGWRMYAPAFAPGSSLQSIPVPVGWETILPMYGLARMKLAEQNTADYEKLKGSYMKDLGDWFRSNKVTTGPRQVGENSGNLEVMPSLGGGWVIP
jgi:hypothetical protein